MRKKSREIPPLPQSILDQLQGDLWSALDAVSTTNDKRLVVNPDSPKWFTLKEGVAKSCVMNSAWFISKAFQKHLVDSGAGWIAEKALGGVDSSSADQKIDAFRTISATSSAYRLTEASFVELIRRLMLEDVSEERSVPPFLELYHGFVGRWLFQIPIWASKHAELFDRADDLTLDFKVGVEFETGNIASSFRALTKLNLLYLLGEIDVGVFITSESKSDAAAVIWPPSNRNGSFEELSRRQYKKIVYFPIWEIAFGPDAIVDNAPYFGKTFKFIPKKTGNQKRDAKGRLFDEFIKPRGPNDATGSRVYFPHDVADIASLQVEQQESTGDDQVLDGD